MTFSQTFRNTVTYRIALVALVFVAASSALADRAAAKAAFEEGSRLYALGRFDAAAAAYERAYEEAPIPALLFNIAQAHLEAKNYERALVFYRSFLREAESSPNRPVALERMKVAEAELAKVEAEKQATAERERLALEAEAKKAEAARLEQESATEAVAAAAREQEARARVKEAEARRAAADAEDEALTSQTWFWSALAFGGVATVAALAFFGTGATIGAVYTYSTTADTHPEVDLR